MTDLSSPHAVQARLRDIEEDLAIRQNDLERAAMAWFKAKRDREKRWAQEFLDQEGNVKTIAERKAVADAETADIGIEDEAEYEATKAVCRVLETRAAIGMALLKSQGRA